MSELEQGQTELLEKSGITWLGTGCWEVLMAESSVLDGGAEPSGVFWQM